jgi:hypothetical protein
MGTAYLGLRQLRLALGDRPEGIARIFTERWRAAAVLRPRPYWTGRAPWLQLRPLATPLTSEQAAAGSSGRPQDPHPC